MKRKNKKNKKNFKKFRTTRGTIIIRILIVGLIIFSLFAVGGIGFRLGYDGTKFQNTLDPTQAKLIPIENTNTKNGQKNLHMDSLQFITVAPTPPPPPVYVPPPQTDVPPPVITQPPYVPPTPKPNLPGQPCVHEQLITNGCTCNGKDALGYDGYLVLCRNGENTGTEWDPSQVTPVWCKYKPDGDYCVGKPVIYLYPTVPTRVDVKLSIPGKVVESIPLYPQSGWKNALAKPDGTLTYQGKEYKELYYETAISHINPPQKGMILAKSELSLKLPQILTQLGLKKSEREEFMDYWMPKLSSLKTNYIFFSLFEKEEKERIDHVDITPQPDTFIELLVYFKPVDLTFKYTPMMLPKNVPQRIGFTAVEWGGTIDETDLPLIFH